MNPKIERLAAPMDKRFVLLAVGALAMVVTGCSQSLTPCQLQQSATGGYVVKLTRVGGATSPACEDAAATPPIFSDVWVFDQYLDFLIVGKSVVIPHPPTSEPNSPVYGKGHFTTELPNDSSPRICTVDSLTTMTNGLSGAALLSYAVTDMEFLSGTEFLGTEWKANAVVERGGCTASYTVQALAPPVGCEEAADCDPFAQPLGSGIQSNYQQTCVLDAWTADAAAFLGSSGVCFLTAEFPSLGAFQP
jgi:hypothetical protein